MRVDVMLPDLTCQSSALAGRDSFLQEFCAGEVFAIAFFFFCSSAIDAAAAAADFSRRHPKQPGCMEHWMEKLPLFHY